MQSSVRRFPLDDLLRKHGWQIAGRPKEGGAKWRKAHLVLSQQDVLESLPLVEVKAAQVAWENEAPL